MTRLRKSAIAARAVTAALVLAHSVFPQAPAPYTITFTQGKDACQTISFPERWITQRLSQTDKKAAQDLGIGTDPGEEFEFRHKADQGDAAIFVSMWRQDDVHSRYKYLVRLDPSPSVQRIDDAEWAGAAFALFTRERWDKQIGGLDIAPVPNRDGSMTALMSETFSQISADKKWAVVFRWHGRLGAHDQGVPSYRLAPSIVPYRNDYSVEIADTETEQKLVVFHGSFTGVSTTNLSDNLGWITNRILWMPLDDKKSTVLICDSDKFETQGSMKR